MEILEGALAFAVIMIILSTIVSGLTEALLRGICKRQGLLAVALGRMFTQLGNEGKLVLPDGDGNGGGGGGDALSQIVDEMTYNPVLGPLEVLRREPGRIGKLLAVWPLTGYAKLFAQHTAAAGEGTASGATRHLRHTQRVDVLSPRGFAERLARSKVTGLNSEAQWREVLSAFVRYRLLSQERYRKYAQRVAMILAFGVAFAFNIDAGRVFVHVMTDTSARDALLLAAPDVVSSYETLQERARTAPDAETRVAIEQEMAALRTLFDDNLEVLTRDAGLPIGLTYYPHCLMAPTANKLQQMIATGDPATGRAAEDGGGGPWPDSCVVEKGKALAGLPLWVVNVVIAGFLIGLGGPFWYKVFSGLSQLTKLLNQVGGNKVPQETFTPPKDKEQTGTGDDTASEVEQALQAALAIRGLPYVGPGATPPARHRVQQGDHET